jgi:lysophospholipid acyltransferase (LPLAT)-like uncharacterized protein
MILFRPIIAWFTALAIVLLRFSCRIRRHGDPRPLLRCNGQVYAYSVLHAHQVSAIMDGEPGTGALVSRSADGGLIIPSLIARGIVPIRGSSSLRGRDKGGMAAFQQLIHHLAEGHPAYFAVDGPRGPRNHVHLGVALLSQKTGAAVLNIIPVPSRRWILRGTWDRLQIPKPFSTIDVHFAEPLFPRDGETAENYRVRIELSLTSLELEHDPVEANHSKPGIARQAGIAAA